MDLISLNRTVALSLSIIPEIIICYSMLQYERMIRVSDYIGIVDCTVCGAYRNIRTKVKVAFLEVEISLGCFKLDELTTIKFDYPPSKLNTLTWNYYLITI